MRYQRVPPTEKRGRVHSSTVTVSALPEPEEVAVLVDERELRWRSCRASGSGGQHVNMTDSAVQVTHLPTGIQLRVESSRSQHLNREAARALLAARLLERAQGARRRRRNALRREQVGSGMRGDKVVTISQPRDSVVHHRTGKRTSWRRYARGHIDDLW